MNLRRKYFAIGLSILAVFFLATGVSYKNTFRFSYPSGFYASDFDLEIYAAPGQQIYYTLDGSEPSLDSTLYTSPIHISDASLNENVYSARTDVSAGYLTDLIEKYNGSPSSLGYPLTYVAPDYLVDKCTIVRAATFQNGEQVDSYSASYFVGFENKSVYDQMYIVSLITDPANMFDSEKGIYVLGEPFDMLLTQPDDLGKSSWWRWSANYRANGIAFERPVYVEVFTPDKSLLFSSDCGIRIQGDSSRGFVPRNLGLFSRTEYSGSDTFPAGLFEDNIQPHKFALYAGGGENFYKIRDWLGHTLCQDLNFATMDFLPCVVFLDGEFWGTYYITESYNAKYIEDHYDVPEDDVILIKNGWITEGEETEREAYLAMYNFITNSDMSLDGNYQTANALIDMDSYLDYYATQIYIGRKSDWPHNNFALWRSRSTAKTSAYQDGRWRWMIFDLNANCMTSDLLEEDTLAYVMEKDPMFQSLCNNEEFKHAFAERIRYVGEEVFSPTKCDAFIDNYLETMLEPLKASATRFLGYDMQQEIFDRSESVRNFFYQRRSYIDSMIAANFGEGY